MDYVGTGRVIRELGAGVAKDAFNVYIQPNAAAGGSKVKEILLLPYNKVITPILTQLKEKIRGKPLSLTIDGEEVNFLLPEKYTTLGLGNEFREILDQHAELSRVYRFMEAGRLHQIKRKEIPSDSPERRLFIDTDMNIYELKDGDDVLLKLFGNGDFLDVPEEVPIRKMVGSGLIPAKEFLKRQHDTVDNRNDFEPYTNIFPAGSSTKSKEKVYNYLDELSNQSLTENGLEKMEILDPSRYNSLIRRLRQERDWEKSTNMGLRLETDINFLKILSNRDLSEIAKSLFRQYKNGGKLNCDDIYKSLNRNFRQVRPNRQIESNPFLDSADKRLSLAIEAGPTFRNILLERGKNLAIDAGVGAAASTMHIWVPAVATAGSALLTFSAWLLNKLISRSGNPENFSERALNEITNFSQQVSAAVIELQKRNSNNAQLIENSNQINEYIREAVNQAIEEYKKYQVSSVKQFERITERTFDKLGSKEENITELPFIEDQIHTLDPPPSPYKFPSKEIKMGKKKGGIYSQYTDTELVQLLQDKYKDNITGLRMQAGKWKKGRKTKEYKAAKTALAILSPIPEPPIPITKISRFVPEPLETVFPGEEFIKEEIQYSKPVRRKRWQRVDYNPEVVEEMRKASIMTQSPMTPTAMNGELIWRASFLFLNF